MSERTFYLLTYDVPDDKRRLKVAKKLEALGERVQYSVFEAWLTEQELQTLEKQLKKVLNETEDSIRIYQICAACREKICTLGLGKPTAPPEVLVI
ncbi:MAG: CRISPR-associated endonuclease Cas2 [Caldilineae bacterium]|nr:MAG: CRISPR-associated endonuclease Cas2 [Caldilineae bacterium]